MSSELVPTVTIDPDQQRWDATLSLVGEWLMEHAGNTRTTYADSIGWPTIINGRRRGQWRGYTTRQELTWLGWCHTNGIHLFDATRLHVLAWIDQITVTTLSKRSKAQLVSTASSFHLWAMREGHTDANPVALVDRRKRQLNPSRDASPTRSLTAAEANALIAAADRDPVHPVRLRTSAIISVLFCVGPRVGEICRATLGDMRTQGGAQVLHIDIKGGKVHDYALPTAVTDRIDAYLAGRDDITRLPAICGRGPTSTTPLFATASGKHMNRREVLTLVKRVATLAGLSDPGSVHPHVGRHTFITEARRLGYTGDSIKSAVGHEQQATTDRYGIHVINLENSPTYGVAESFVPTVSLSQP